jgi:hypothetical protein
MRLRLIAAVIGTVTTLAALPPLAAPPAFGRSRKVVKIHVSIRHAHADDSNRGTLKRPVKTLGEGIKRAIAAGQKGRGARVIVHDGVYRESVTIPDNGSASIQVVGIGRPVVSGSDVWTGWTRQGASNVFEHAWSFGWGMTPIPEGWEPIHDYIEARPMILRTEMLFVGGKHLRQVPDKSQVDAKPGTYFVNEAADRIYVHIPKKKASANPRIEVATRPRLMTFNGRSNVLVQGFEFRHARTPIGEGGALTFNGGSGLRIINNRFVWNNWNGLSLYDHRNVLVEDNVGNFNGSGGITASYVRGLRMVSNETSYNNWRGAIGSPFKKGDRAVDHGLIDWATGQKFLHLRDAVFTNHKSVGNRTGGLWFDYDNKNVVITGAILVDNLTHGVFVEASQGPVKITNSRICWNETGVLVQDSRNGVIRRSAVGSNKIGQIFLVGLAEPRTVTDSETGERLKVRAEKWKVTSNKSTSQSDQRAIGTYLPKEPWDHFVSTLRSKSNKWGHGERKDIFQIVDGKRLTLKGWRKHTGQDLDSHATPSSKRCKT